MSCKNCTCKGFGGIQDANLTKQKSIVENNLNSFLGIMDNVLQTADNIDNAILDIENQVNEVLTNYVTKPLFAIMAIQGILKKPALIATKISNKINAYSDFIDILAGNDAKTYSEKALTNLFASSAATGSCIATTTGKYTDRSEALYVSNQLASIKTKHDTLVNNIEGIIPTDITENYNVGIEYALDVHVRTNMNNLFVKTINYIGDVVYDLPSKSSIILDRDRHYIELCYQVYGNLDNLDNFVSDNNIIDNEFRYLKKGRNIVYYNS